MRWAASPHRTPVGPRQPGQISQDGRCHAGNGTAVCRGRGGQADRRGCTPALMRIHFIGICGYAVSGLALVAKQLGHEVTGSDEDAYPPTTDILTQAGIKWVDGHTAGNVMRWGKPDLVVQGNQVREGNPETEAARRHQIRLVSEAEYWGELTADRFRIVVAGSAGKTTPPHPIAWILRSAGGHPPARPGGGGRGPRH